MKGLHRSSSKNGLPPQELLDDLCAAAIGEDKYCSCRNRSSKRKTVTAPPGWAVVGKKRSQGIKSEKIVDKAYIEPGTNKRFRSAKSAWAHYAAQQQQQQQE